MFTLGRIARLTLTALALSGSAAVAQALTPQDALARLFNAPVVEGEFAPSFRSQVSVAQIKAAVAQYTQALGALRSVEAAPGGKFTLTFARGVAPAQVALNALGQVTGLWFGAPVLAGGLDAALKGFESLPGSVSILVTRDGQDLKAVGADTPLAVGSAFKLAVLAALQDQAQAGKRAWSDVLPLPAANKSLPSGMLQNWPDGTPLTLATLATLMISISDNTAADTLLNLVGREAVERYAPHQGVMLATSEVFKLVAPENAALLAKYRAASSADRRALLAVLDKLPLPSVTAITSHAPALDIEWRFTTRELCGLMARVQALPYLSVNPGVADPSQWARVTFKGGSDVGVINLTTGLLGADGHAYCVSVTQNDPKNPLDETKFATLTASLIGALK